MILPIILLVIIISVCFSSFYLGKDLFSLLGKCEFTPIDNLKFWTWMIVLTVAIMIGGYLTGMPITTWDWVFFMIPIGMFLWGLVDVNES